MKKVILSGATGYFGALTKKYLQDDGYVICSAGRSQSSDLYFDLDDPDSFAGLNFLGGDAFIHAAAANEVECVEKPYQALFRNVAGTRAALDFCVKNNIKKFIYISTFHVYGKDTGVIDESTQPEPKHDYGLTHLQAEEYVKMYSRKGVIDGVILRPSNMFDMPLDLNTFNRWSLIPFGFCKSAIYDGKIELRTSGDQERNFVSVKDIVKVIKIVIHDEMKAEVINVPGASDLSVKMLAMLVKKIARMKFNIDVDVVAPNGNKPKDSLHFKSNAVSPSDLGFGVIDEHIFRLCKELIHERSV